MKGGLLYGVLPHVVILSAVWRALCHYGMYDRWASAVLYSAVALRIDVHYARTGNVPVTLPYMPVYVDVARAFNRALCLFNIRVLQVDVARARGYGAEFLGVDVVYIDVAAG